VIEIVEDTWLARIMERPVHRVTGAVPVGDDVSRRRLKALAEQPGFSYARVATADMHSVDAFQAAGFRVVDTSVTLVASGLRAPETLTDRVRPGSTARPARASDASAVEKIAREGFSLSRFHLDLRIPVPLANEIKGQWAANFFHGGRGDHMVVIERGSAVAGFLQLLAGHDGVLVIDLIAVASAHRKQGLASAMIRDAAQRYGQGAGLRVGTQAANLESLRLYQSLGFEMSATSYVLHCHPPATGG
jgi:dTDP-4-amino-4,6-dideoxy-D-galactose acyltransferase